MSIIVAIISVVLGAGILYTTSQKVKLRSYPVVVWIQQHRLVSRLISFLLLFIGFYYCVSTLGWAIGIFFVLVILMMVLSLIVLLVPLFSIQQKMKSSFNLLREKNE